MLELIAENSLAGGGNSILNALVAENIAVPGSALQLIALHPGQTIFADLAPAEWVLFPLSGLIAQSLVRTDGSTVTVATVGKDGMIGQHLLPGLENMRLAAVSCVAGNALAMRSCIFREVAAEAGPLQMRLSRYAGALLNEVVQSLCCAHTADARYARCVLLSCDRVGADQLTLTQDCLSGMLDLGRGATRGAAGLLKRAGLISYSRSRLAVIDRAGLENAACACYRTIKKGYAPGLLAQVAATVDELDLVGAAALGQRLQ